MSSKPGPRSAKRAGSAQRPRGKPAKPAKPPARRARSAKPEKPDKPDKPARGARSSAAAGKRRAAAGKRRATAARSAAAPPVRPEDQAAAAADPNRQPLIVVELHGEDDDDMGFAKGTLEIPRMSEPSASPWSTRLETPFAERAAGAGHCVQCNDAIARGEWQLVVSDDGATIHPECTLAWTRAHLVDGTEAAAWIATLLDHLSEHDRAELLATLERD